jgi:6-phosphofructokinase
VCDELLQLDGLVVVGGDDSNTNAAYLAEYFAQHNSRVRVLGVPKTIDGEIVLWSRCRYCKSPLKRGARTRDATRQHT